MTIETVPIDSIQPDPANLRKHSAENLSRIMGSLARFGQQRPIVIDSRGIVLAGNGTPQATKGLGWPEINVVRTDLTGSAATAYAIADNRTGESSSWDQPALDAVLLALRAEDADLAAATGYSLDEIAALVSGDAGDPEAPVDFPSVDESISTEHRCPKCAYVWSGSSSAKGAA